MVLTVQDKRRFVEKLDFMTTPGWLDGGDSREKSGLPPGTGPYRIITNMAVMDFEPVSKRMRVISIHSGFSFEDIQAHCGFKLIKAETLAHTPDPTDLELSVLRKDVDPKGYLIGR